MEHRIRLTTMSLLWSGGRWRFVCALVVNVCAWGGVGLLILLGWAAMSGCAQRTSHIRAVEPFDIERYGGRWYEIARLPHSFEKGLTHVTAEYTLEADGSVRVVNRGYEATTGRWKTARAKARPASDGWRGELRVTFFWPFSAAYRVIELDQENYEYAVVTSGTMRYFWVLSRSPEMDSALLERLLSRARDLGFDLTDLILVDQSLGSAGVGVRSG